MKEIINFFELVFRIMTLDMRHEEIKLELKRAQDLYTRFKKGEQSQIKILEKKCTDSVRDIDMMTKEIEDILNPDIEYITFKDKMQEFYNCRRIRKEFLENEGILNSEIESIDITLEYASNLKFSISKEETMNLLLKRQKLEENQKLISKKIENIMEKMDEINESIVINLEQC